MLKRKHNDQSKLFLQKLLSFIDATLNNAFSDDQKAKQVTIAGLLNLKDAIFAELIRENTIIEINSASITKENQDEKKKEEDLEKDLEKLEPDQSE